MKIIKYLTNLTLIMGLCLILLVSCTDKKEVSISSNYTKTSTPTLFIHGYSGTKNSFGKMIKRIEDNNSGKKELVLNVTANGEIKPDGEITGDSNNPMVQIIFENNKSDEWSQSDWIKNCLEYLKTEYKINNVNIIAHSMGGASTLRYLINNNTEDLPVIKKFIAIGTPFNNFIELQNNETLDSLIKNGPMIKSNRYLDYEKNIDKISSNLEILLIAGDVEDGSFGDEAVPMADALSIISLFKNNGNKIVYEKYFGKNAQHSALHENKDVDKKVSDFLWK